ncbi:unnamed protein product [Brachionus calyciflorus]|uniref:DUF4062 domain-containing protein n=1 Tax=Brachionus calyciflorus TaxID=104777 RepID=A0A813MVZ1_9BILA|nr:unnamed protein product [Brachionus calyciflorus]
MEAKVDENPEETEEEIHNRIFVGDFENLPSIASKIVRIFTSSTFTDTAVERNLLMETVYPKLKEYCREQHGLEFQVVDMRWGVRDESTDDHKTTELCMQEIDNCQRLSLGPNFVVFLGQKYGYRPLPTRVLDSEFNMIIDILEDDDAKLMQLWYKLDTNSVPNVFVLQPVSSIYKNFTNKAQKQLMEEDQSAWWKTMGQLCTIIRKGAARLLEAKKFSNEDNHRYNWSVTEQEVVRGILNFKNNPDHTLAFIREIRNINVKLFTHSAKFIDINFAARKIDDEAQKMLSLLRDVKVPEKLIASSIIPYSIEWSDNEGINKEDHAAYLKEFCETFYSRIVELIERAISKRMKLCYNK